MYPNIHILLDIYIYIYIYMINNIYISYVSKYTYTIRYIYFSYIQHYSLCTINMADIYNIFMYILYILLATIVEGDWCSSYQKGSLWALYIQLYNTYMHI